MCGLRAPLFLGQSEVKSSQQKDVRVQNVHPMVGGNERERVFEGQGQDSPHRASKMHP